MSRTSCGPSGVVGVCACLVTQAALGQTVSRPTFETYAIEMAVVDLDRALKFYRDVVGFERQDDGTTSGWAFLGLGRTRLVLRERPGGGPQTAPAVNLNLYVDDLDRTIAKWQKQGVVFATDRPEPFALGTAIRLRDQDGNSIHLLNVTAYDLPTARSPLVFNVGLRFADLLASESFFAETLGIPVSSRAYLPKTLALKKVGAFPMVLHQRDSDERPVHASHRDSPRVVLATGDLRAARARILESGGKTIEGVDETFWCLPSLTVAGKEGHVFRVVQVPTFAVPSRAGEMKLASVADLSWIAGSWTRSDEDGILRETWSEPLGGQMMGMFQWIKDGETWINEFCTITETDGEIAFRLRHFSGRMIAWESKDAPFYYPLKSNTGRKAIFENPMRNSPRQVVFSRPGDDALQIDVVGYEGDKESGRWEFKYDRAK